MPPLFVINSDGKLKSRQPTTASNVLIVDRFAAADPWLGARNSKRSASSEPMGDLTSNTEQGGHKPDGCSAGARDRNELRLRPERPHVTRGSRKALIGGTALLILLAVFLALQTREKRAPAPDELYSTDHHTWRTSLRACQRTTVIQFPRTPRPGAAFAR